MQSNFNLGPLSQWAFAAVGEVFTFDLPLSGVRNVQLDVFATERVVCTATCGDAFWPVAVGDGLMAVSFVTDKPVGIAFHGPEEAEIRFRTRVETQLIDEDGEPTYTTIEPRNGQPSEEVQRMMNMMRLNQLRMNQQLAAEREAMNRRLEEALVERQAPPTLAERQKADADADAQHTADQEDAARREGAP